MLAHAPAAYTLTILNFFDEKKTIFATNSMLIRRLRDFANDLGRPMMPVQDVRSLPNLPRQAVTQQNA
jgi:hypothetical protein